MEENRYTKMLKAYECSGDPFYPSYGISFPESKKTGFNASNNLGKSVDSEVLKFSIGELKIKDVSELEKHIPSYVEKAGSLKLALSYEPLADGQGQGEHVNRIYSLDDENKFVVQAWADNRREVDETLDDMRRNIEGVFSKEYVLRFDGASEATISKPKHAQIELDF